MLHYLGRAVGRAIIGELFKAGLSQMHVLGILKREGLAYPTGLFRKDWREITRVLELERITRYIPKGAFPTLKSMVKKASPVGGKYTYTHEVELFDPSTGDRMKRHMSISTDKKLKIGEAESATVGVIEREEYAPGYYVEQIQTIAVKYR